MASNSNASSKDFVIRFGSVMMEFMRTNDATAELSALSPVFSSALGCDSICNPALAALYERGKRQQWNATSDLNWKIESRFGSRLPEDSLFALTCFETSPLARFGRSMWDAF